MSLTRGQLRLYTLRLRSQPLSRTFRDLANPHKVARALTRSTGAVGVPSNPYTPSLALVEEIRFAALLASCSEDAITELVAQIDSDRDFVGELRDRYAANRPGSQFHLGRFRILYALARALRPSAVVETGVHDGLSSALLLCALARNDRGLLVSVDLPSTDLPVGVEGPGWLVPERLRGRWQLERGDARRVLPPVAAAHAPVDLFIHDSDHSREHQEFEFRTVRPLMAAGGVMLSDQDYPFDPLLDELADEWRLTHHRVRTVAGDPGGYMGGLSAA